MGTDTGLKKPARLAGHGAEIVSVEDIPEAVVGAAIPKIGTRLQGTDTPIRTLPAVR
jgi:hypothetical protein